jgi:hypothetical protein
MQRRVRMDAAGWAAYRQELMDLVGSDDPATVQEGGPGRLEAMVGAAGDAINTRPAPGEWSVLELVGHTLDAEIMASARYRWILAHDGPELMAYDQDLFAGSLRYRDADPSVLLAAFAALRRANLELWGRTTEAERDREGKHAERGPSSYRVLFTEIAGHDRFHLTQAERTLAAVRAE